MSERMALKFGRRSERFSAFGGFVLTLLEFFAFLTTLRFFWRLGRRVLGLPTGGLWRKESAPAAGPVHASQPVLNP
jgi:hypothetical protein